MSNFIENLLFNLVISSYFRFVFLLFFLSVFSLLFVFLCLFIDIFVLYAPFVCLLLILFCFDKWCQFHMLLFKTRRTLNKMFRFPSSPALTLLLCIFFLLCKEINLNLLMLHHQRSPLLAAVCLHHGCIKSALLHFSLLLPERHSDLQLLIMPLGNGKWTERLQMNSHLWICLALPSYKILATVITFQNPVCEYCKPLCSCCFLHLRSPFIQRYVTQFQICCFLDCISNLTNTLSNKTAPAHINTAICTVLKQGGFRSKTC